MKVLVKRLMTVFIVSAAIGLCLNCLVKASARGRIIRDGDYSAVSDADCIIVLGAGIDDDGGPSPILEDRLIKGLELYDEGVSRKLLMSGDHGRVEHDEVNLMKNYAIEQGVPSESVFMDHAGFSTYETMYRARDVFQAQKVVIVTQSYHLYRAVYIANQLGLDAYGVSTDPRYYGGELYREAREILARDKDFFKCILKPEPTYLGDPIPISGSGDATND